MSISVLMDQDVLNGQSIRVADQSNAIYTLMTTVGVDIQLPFPTNVTSTAAPQWEGSDRSKISMLAEAGMTGDVYETLKGWGAEMKDVVNQTMKASTTSFGMVGAAFLGKEQMLHNAGKALNPFKQMMFSGMDFRTYDLEFEIIPKSEKEAEQLRQAIRSIQVHSMPEILDGQAGLFMNYPDTWQVEFIPMNGYLPAFLPSVITNVSIDYAGAAGRVIFKENHAPVSVNVSLSFAETEIFTKAKADKFYG